MNYTYRVYNALTGHEYADVDSLETAELLVAAMPNVLATIDMLVAA